MSVKFNYILNLLKPEELKNTVEVPFYKLNSNTGNKTLSLSKFGQTVLLLTNQISVYGQIAGNIKQKRSKE